MARFCMDSGKIRDYRSMLTSQNFGGGPTSNAVLRLVFWYFMHMHLRFSALKALYEKCAPFLHIASVSAAALARRDMRDPLHV